MSKLPPVFYYVITGCLFCVAACVITLGIVFAENGNCSIQSAILNSTGEQMKLWTRNTQTRCVLFGVGCQLVCENRCNKLVKEMAATESKTNSDAAAMKYRCSYSNASGLNETTDAPAFFSEGDIPLR